LGGLAREPLAWAISLLGLTVVVATARERSRIREELGRWFRDVDRRWPLRQLLPDAGTALLLVLGLSLLARVLWLNLPSGSLIFDEAYYVNAARVILGIHPPAGAHYADAPLFLDPNTEHPPLGKVLIAGSMALLGDNGFGWRVPSVIAAMAALAALYGIVRGLSGRPWLGVLAVGLYSLDILSFIHGRIGTLDMLSVAFLLVGAWLCGA
jgi:4-amino-4-deoxy-L-arabinose transferase-like glycosyltransferase